MAKFARRALSAASRLTIAVSSAAILASCTSTPVPTASIKPTKSKEYFAETEYGVKASPRVTNKRTRLKRGGGRDQVGRPYRIKGKMYYPKEDPDYRKVGAASWYGDAFHGRLTANGEIYDMTHLTAAHPTMPLPSYARVTNTKNGSSIIVRVNDRGPYAHGRIIDLSRRAAELLDYTHAGVAKVEVEYVGRAPLHGQDDEYLMASYRPGDRGPSIDDGLPSGVMIAMNGPSPSVSVGSGVATASAFPGLLTNGGNRNAAPAAAPAPVPAPGADIVVPGLPDVGPIVPERPPVGLARAGGATPAPLLSYADTRVEAAAGRFASFATGLSPAQIVRAWEDGRHSPVHAGGYVAVGTWSDRAEADAMAERLSRFGDVSVERVVEDGVTWHSVTLRGDGRTDADGLLEAAWAAGAVDAMAIRD